MNGPVNGPMNGFSENVSRWQKYDNIMAFSLSTCIYMGTLSPKSRQAWRNALLSENIDHSRFAEPGAE